MRKWVSIVIVMQVFVFTAACNRGVDIDQEKQSIQQVFDKYLESVKTADAALASQVWQQSEEVSAVIPLGRFKGWKSIEQDLYVNFLQKAFTERSLKPANLAIDVSGTAAWVVYDWTFNGKLPDGQAFSSSGWESQVYQKVDGRWAIVHIHYSSPVRPPQ
jgi:ketosteroid isomerase-like protein